MPDIFHKVAGAWKKTNALSVKVAGAWKNVPSAWVKVAGAWKLVYSAGGGGVDMGDILRSVRFRAATNGNMTRTFAAPTLQNTFAWSAWVKRGALGTLQYLFSCAANGVRFTTADSLELLVNNAIAFTSAEKFRDPTAWMHVHWRQHAGGSELSVNGAVIGTTASVSTAINSAVAHNLGSLAAASYLNGYLARVCFMDGQYLAASDFGLANSEGTWISKSQAACKAIVDGPGNNNFMLEFDTGAALADLGNDFSDNNNDWTVNAGISITAGSTYDWMTDTPSNNHATLNPLNSHNVNVAASLLFNGNLQINSVASANAYGAYGATISAASGKYYWEIIASTNNASISGGVEKPNNGPAINPTNIYFAGLPTGSSIYRNSIQVQGGFAAFTAGSVLSVLLDLDAKTLQFRMNGADIGALITGVDAGEWMPLLQPQSSAAGNSTAALINFGQHPFIYTTPAGFEALSTANLDAAGTVITSGSFTGNANVNGPFVWLGGVPETMTINGNAVTWGTHADKTAGGFKLRTAAATHNASGTNNFTVTVAGEKFKYANAQVNP